MFSQLFETRARKIADESELRRLFSKYGDNAVSVLQERLQQPSLTAREQQHWRRILRKARRMPAGSA